jgi:hypothetical protein
MRHAAPKIRSYRLALRTAYSVGAHVRDIQLFGEAASSCSRIAACCWISNAMSAATFGMTRYPSSGSFHTASAVLARIMSSLHCLPRRELKRCAALIHQRNCRTPALAQGDNGTGPGFSASSPRRRGWGLAELTSPRTMTNILPGVFLNNFSGLRCILAIEAIISSWLGKVIEMSVCFRIFTRSIWASSRIKPRTGRYPLDTRIF